ncbi:hypothetical protein VDF76_09290, partial [Xanthomonas campestris pv. raphani]|uniref:hypothetical protein n=1 Tax=Xanthomonas campestris TaxID=339 RepID=UPI002B23C909
MSVTPVARKRAPTDMWPIFFSATVHQLRALSRHVISIRTSGPARSALARDQPLSVMPIARKRAPTDMWPIFFSATVHQLRALS